MYVAVLRCTINEISQSVSVNVGSSYSLHRTTIAESSERERGHADCDVKNIINILGLSCCSESGPLNY